MENGQGNLTKREWECLEMFVLFEAGVKNDLLLKVNVKEWEYKLYGGRPEFYPEDRKAIITMQGFRSEINQHKTNKATKHAELKQKLARMRASGQGFIGDTE
jgi:hypothetical protein